MFFKELRRNQKTTDKKRKENKQKSNSSYMKTMNGRRWQEGHWWQVCKKKQNKDDAHRTQPTHAAKTDRKSFHRQKAGWTKSQKKAESTALQWLNPSDKSLKPGRSGTSGELAHAERAISSLMLMLANKNKHAKNSRQQSWTEAEQKHILLNQTFFCLWLVGREILFLPAGDKGMFG